MTAFPKHLISKDRRWIGPRYDFSVEFKDFDEKAGTFRGIANRTDHKDLVGDVIERGAFKRTVGAWQKKHDRTGHNVPMLWSHNVDQVIGGYPPHKMEETSKGLEVEGVFTMAMSQARDVRENAIAGNLGGLSIGFTIPQGKARIDGNTRFVSEVRLWEVSPVVFPANDRSFINDVKGLESDDPIEALIEALEEFREAKTDEAKATAAALIEKVLPLLRAADPGTTHSATEGPGDKPSDSDPFDSLVTAIKRLDDQRAMDRLTNIAKG